MKNLVIAKTPRKNPALVFGALTTLAIFGCSIVYLSAQDLLQFGIEEEVKISSFSIKSISCLFFVFLFVAILIAAIRNNAKSQTIETFFLIFGLVFSISFVLFSDPLLFLWAHIHGYHLDHYEPAHRGGWYIFDLNGTARPDH